MARSSRMKPSLSSTPDPSFSPWCAAAPQPTSSLSSPHRITRRPTQVRTLTARNSSSRAHPRPISTISTSYLAKSFVESPSVRHHRLSPFTHIPAPYLPPPILLTVRRIEDYATSSGDVPVDPIVIADAGELSPSDPSLTEPVVASDGDPYEDHPEDDSRDTQDLKVVLEAATTLRTLGNARWKESAAADALAKWQKALRYLDVHHDAP